MATQMASQMATQERVLVVWMVVMDLAGRESWLNVRKESFCVNRYGRQGGIVDGLERGSDGWNTCRDAADV